MKRMTPENNTKNSAEVQHMTVKEYASQVTPSKINSIHIFLMIVMMFLGFSIGQITGLENFKNLVTEKIESDVYATLEFAALNSMATEDLSDIEKELNAIKPLLNNEDAKTRINQLISKLEVLKETYSHRRNTFKKELKNASQHKKLLYNSIETNTKESKELKVSLAELYLLRLMELLSKKDLNKMDQFTPEENELISRVISNIITLSPKHEETIIKLFPKISSKFILKEEGQPQGLPSKE